MRLTDKQLDEFIAISEKSGIKYKTRAEAYNSALSLLRLTSVIIKKKTKKKQVADWFQRQDLNTFQDIRNIHSPL